MLVKAAPDSREVFCQTITKYLELIYAHVVDKRFPKLTVITFLIKVSIMLRRLIKKRLHVIAKLVFWFEIKQWMNRFFVPVRLILHRS